MGRIVGNYKLLKIVVLALGGAVAFGANADTAGLDGSVDFSGLACRDFSCVLEIAGVPGATLTIARTDGEEIDTTD